MKSTSILPLLLSCLLSLAQCATREATLTTECMTTKSDSITRSRATVNGEVTTSNYVVTVERQTIISPCAPVPTGDLAAGEEPSWDPYTATHIRTQQITYNDSVSREPTSTSVTNTWVHFPIAEPYAKLTDLRPNCNCTSSARSETEDDRCADRGLETKCSVQCGNNGGRFSCLVESTDETDFYEGRICVKESKNGQKIEYLGEPCHIGDVMNDCTICFD